MNDDNVSKRSGLLLPILSIMFKLNDTFSMLHRNDCYTEYLILCRERVAVVFSVSVSYRPCENLIRY